MSIQTDDISASMSEDAAVEALMKGMGEDPTPEGQAEPVDNDEEDEPEAPEAPDEYDEEENPEAPEADEDEDSPSAEEAAAALAAAKAPKEAADDQTITVTVDGVETTHTVASLKRLAGQEASLTRKSQEADTVGQRAAAVLNTAIEATLEDLEPYKDVDWLVLQNQLDPGEFEWHRAQAARHQARFDKLVGSARTFEEGLAARRDSSTTERAVEAVKELTADVPGWNDKLYGDIMSYAVTQGLDEADVASIANAKVIKLLHKAMLHDAGKKAVAQKVKSVPERITKPSRQSAANTTTIAAKKSQERLNKGTGSDNDAIAVLMGRWK